MARERERERLHAQERAQQRLEAARFGVGFRVSEFGFRVSGFGFRVSGLGLRV